MLTRWFTGARPAFTARAFSSVFENVPMGPPDPILGITEVRSTCRCPDFLKLSRHLTPIYLLTVCVVTFKEIHEGSRREKIHFGRRRLQVSVSYVRSPFYFVPAACTKLPQQLAYAYYFGPTY